MVSSGKYLTNCFSTAKGVVALLVKPNRLLTLNTCVSTAMVGLLYTMIALWLLSIFGNFSDYEQWLKVRQFQIFYWGLLGIAISLGLALYGMKTKDHVSRDIGFVFFILNLYTRFVEYLWDNLNRTIFFLLLAVSFWFVGRWAESIWKKR